MSVDYHVKQITGSRCGPYNCAAASSAMAIAYAGGPLLSADRVRTLSGVSCTPGDDTVSGGLRSTDTYWVAKSFGIELNYGGGNGAVMDWPVSALEYRLRIGQGCIVLGDCQEAPTNPSYNVIYHSAFVHGFRVYSGVEQTHWHDPRNSTATWQSVAGVIRYWQGMSHGFRFAGFVVPNQVGAIPDTSTGDPPIPPPAPDPAEFDMSDSVSIEQPMMGVVTLPGGKGYKLINPADRRLTFGPYPFDLHLYVYDRLDLKRRVPGTSTWQYTDIDGQSPPRNDRHKVWRVQDAIRADTGARVTFDCAAYALRSNTTALRPSIAV